MKPFVGVSSVSSLSALVKLVEDEVKGSAFYVCDNERQMSDIHTGKPSADVLEKYSRGKVFCETTEVRWQKAGKSTWQVILLSDESRSGFRAVAAEWRTRDVQMQLLGKRVNQECRMDTRYPRTFRHPGIKGDRAFVSGKEYIDTVSGRLHYIRWQSIGGSKHA